MNFVLRHLELVFTVAGLGVIFGVTAFFHPDDTSPWTVAAITATAVGVIHGALFWLVRRRQRLLRRRTLLETERMLRDVVLNQVAVIRMAVDLQNQPNPGDSRLALQRIEDAITVINATLTDVSEESLIRWQSRYTHLSAPR